MATTNFSSVSELIIDECRPVSGSHTKVHSKLVKQVSTLLNGLEVAEATKEWSKVMNDLTERLDATPFGKKPLFVNTALRRLVNKFTGRITKFLRYTVEGKITLPTTWPSLIAQTDELAKAGEAPKGKFDPKSGAFRPVNKDATARKKKTSRDTGSTGSTVDALSLKGQEVEDLIVSLKGMTKQSAIRWAKIFQAQIDEEAKQVKLAKAAKAKARKAAKAATQAA